MKNEIKNLEMFGKPPTKFKIPNLFLCHPLEKYFLYQPRSHDQQLFVYKQVKVREFFDIGYFFNKSFKNSIDKKKNKNIVIRKL